MNKNKKLWLMSKCLKGYIISISREWGFAPHNWLEVNIMRDRMFKVKYNVKDIKPWDLRGI